MKLIKPDENGKYPKQALPSRLLLAIRMIVAIYLLYLVFGLRDSFVPPIEKEDITIIIAAIIFTIAAIIIIFFSVRSLMTGRYQGGALDADVLDDDAVKHIEGLDNPENEPIAHTPSSSSEPVDEFDPHNVVYKHKKFDSE